MLTVKLHSTFKYYLDKQLNWQDILGYKHFQVSTTYEWVQMSMWTWLVKWPVSEMCSSIPLNMH